MAPPEPKLAAEPVPEPELAESELAPEMELAAEMKLGPALELEPLLPEPERLWPERGIFCHAEACPFS